MTRNWMLPDGVEEWLPPSSWALEDLRRKLLDLYRDRGYGLIYTPLFEHLDTLLVGAGSDLESLTFKLVDPASGRLLGLRADMTPQAARIVARRFDQSDVVRLCYIGTVLRTQPDAMGGSRAPRQVGCELFGDASMNADHEILRLLAETLKITGVDTRRTSTWATSASIGRWWRVWDSARTMKPRCSISFNASRNRIIRPSVRRWVCSLNRRA